MTSVASRASASSWRATEWRVTAPSSAVQMPSEYQVVQRSPRLTRATVSVQVPGGVSAFQDATSSRNGEETSRIGPIASPLSESDGSVRAPERSTMSPASAHAAKAFSAAR